MRSLEDKIKQLEERLEEKKTADDELDMTRAKRDVKEEASKGQKVDIDVLHERLVILESIARKQNSDFKDKISLILSRFHSHKSNPTFAAALVLKLVCSKEEEQILDKEQKLMKNFGMYNKQENAFESNYGLNHMITQQQGFGVGRFPYSFGPPPPRFSYNPRRFLRPRAPVSAVVCYRCNKPGHMIRDCPVTVTSSN